MIRDAKKELGFELPTEKYKLESFINKQSFDDVIATKYSE